MTREQVCARMHDQVRRIAQKSCGRRGTVAGLTFDDFVSHGVEGLLEAFDRFDGDRGSSFDVFAKHRVRGAMRDALRAQDTLSRRRRQLHTRIQRASEAVRRRTQREARTEEVAEQAELSLDAYWTALWRVQPAVVVSLDVSAGDDPDDGLALHETIANSDESPSDQLVHQAQVYAHLKVAIRALPDRQRECVILYYERGLSQAEVAAVYGITVSRVSQLLSASRQVLRTKLADVVDASDLA